MNKKILKSLATIAMLGASVSWAQEFELNFANELSSDIVTIDKIWDDETNFAGIVENASVEFSSEKVDAYLEVEFTLGTGKGNETSETNHLNFAWTDLDYWLHFRPFKMITLAFHDDLWMSGSYLPLWDDNAPAGGLGSSGFSLMVEPLEGLRIAATIPMDNLDEGLANFLNGDEDEKDEDGNKKEQKPFDFGLGAEYDFGELFSVGAKVGDIIDSDEIYFGVFAAFRPFKSDDLIIRAGYGHYEGVGVLEELDYSENIAIAGKNIFNASLEWVLNDFAIAAEIVGDTDVDDENEDFAYDMYIGAKAAYSFAENFAVGLGAQCFLDFGETKAKPVFGIEPSLGCAFGNHEFSLAADFEFCDGDIFVKFPISWIYSF